MNIGFHEVGERFEYKGNVLEVIEDSYCKCCFFNNSWICELMEIPKYCGTDTRFDNKSISYKLVEQCKTKNMEQKTEAKNTSKKNDRIDDKPMWELLPLQDIEDVVKVYTAGAKKYGPDKWQNLPDGYKRYKAALFRHLLEYEKGNWLDEETGCIHLAQVVWNAIAMLHIEKERHGNK